MDAPKLTLKSTQDATGAFHAAHGSASFAFLVDTLPDAGETRQTNVFDKIERAKASGVRQFVFIFPVDEFKAVEAKFAALRAKLKLKSNTEVLIALLHD
ncbi:MAG: hypothetical protein EBR82_28550 [Caulobacteraceae bacterium]|nr:hypothetical protein [Caulobacteraceae bacterium]